MDNKDSKFGQFEAAFENGQRGQVSDYETWLESHGFRPERVSTEVIRSHFTEHTERTVDYDQQLQEVGEFAGHFAARGGTIHLAVTGVSGVGKTLFRRTVEDALDRVEAGLEVYSFECNDLGDKVTIGESDPSMETYEESRLQKVAEDVAGDENAVFILDDCGEDKRARKSMTRLESSVENGLFVTFWSPELWGYDRDEIEREIDTTKQIKLPGLSKTECSELASALVEFIGGDAALSEDAVVPAFKHSNGIPGLFIQVLVKSLKQAFLEGQEPWDSESIDQAVDQLGITDATERVGSLSQAKLQLIRHMLIDQDPRGIRPKRLVELLDRDKSTISYHLNDLLSRGLVDSVTEGRSVRYSVDRFIKPIVQMRLEKEVEING
ncbi:hypothetical protein [Halobaculum sp. MBLA0143]|uniref:hypothetical protein n=1 Tax=Halobaculum sp. MBLA0143 TaxID=3079933 RepID=UPI00352410F9